MLASAAVNEPRDDDGFGLQTSGGSYDGATEIELSEALYIVSQKQYATEFLT